MATSDFNVSISPSAAMNIITDYILNSSSSGEIIDSYSIPCNDGKECCFAVIEKYYHRAGNRLTLSIVISDIAGATHVHAVAGGAGQGAFFKFSWYAEEDFSEAAEKALKNYMI